MQGFGLLLQQAGQQRADHGVRIEFVEGRVGVHGGGVQADGAEARQGGFGGVLLALQAARDATIEAQAEAREVIAQYFGLANSDAGKHVVVIGAE